MNKKLLPVNDRLIQELIENLDNRELLIDINEDPLEDTASIENENEEKEKKKSYAELEEADNNNKDCKEKDLETQASRKYLAGHSKISHHKSRFTSTWVQYESGEYGFAYGGADPLNYDPSTKNRFLRKVYSIVLVMLIITIVYNFCSATMDLQSFYREDSCLLIVISAGVYLFILNWASAVLECARIFPWKFIATLLVLAGTCIVGGYISVRYKTMLLIYMYITETAVVIVFIIIACTPFDFTSIFLHLIALGVALPFAIIFVLYAHTGTMENRMERDPYSTNTLVLFFIGCLLNVLIMTIVLQILLKSGAVEMTEDDYTLGAFYIYTSIYDIFFKIIQLILVTIGEGKSD